jgi:hypothetical protein
MAALLLCLPLAASASALNWTGGAANGDWFDSANWSPAQVPTASDDATIDANSTVTVSGASPAAFASLTLGDAAGTNAPMLKVAGSLSSSGLLTVEPRASLQQASANQLSLGQVIVAPGGVLTHAPNAGTRVAVLNLSVSGDFDLQAGATITANGLGYAGGAPFGAGSGPGGGGEGDFVSGAGGGHGGNGGNGAGGTAGGKGYDSITSPTDLGSGGGGHGNGGGKYGSPGGGAILISVGGNFNLNGLIDADGGGTTQGGGAGGSVNITANNLAGTGIVHADGGGGVAGGGGGGGGEIAVAVDGIDSSGLTVRADPGPGVSGGLNGGAGVIARKEAGATLYSLTIGTPSVPAQAATPLYGSAPTFMDVTVDNSSVTFDAGSTAAMNHLVIAGTASVTAATLSPDAIEIKSGGILQLAAQATGGALQVDSGGVFEQTNAAQLTFSQVTVQPGGILTHATNAATRAFVLDLSVTGDFDLQAGATITANGLGYAGGAPYGAGAGPGGGGEGDFVSGAGGGHGGDGGSGAGGTAGGNGYDSIVNPTNLGSGGGGHGNGGGKYGSPGGGAILIAVGGSFNLNGLIEADGGGTTQGGGAGGSVNITANNLAGAGVVHAVGGNGVGGGGGGGGGVIAVAVGGVDSSGLTVSADPGLGVSGGLNGGAGVIARKEAGATSYSLGIGGLNVLSQAPTPIRGAAPAFANVTLGNARVAFDTGSAAAFGPLVIVGTAVVSASTLMPSLTEVRGGALLQIAAQATGGFLQVDAGGTLEQLNTAQLSFSSASILSGGIITHAANALTRVAVVNIKTAGDFDLQAGATITANRLGYAGGTSYGIGAGPGGGGEGDFKSGAGGGHGGNGGSGAGGTAGGTKYDVATNPGDLGSGGGGCGNGCGRVGSVGGGAILISVGGTLNLNGEMGADGAATSQGGGAGGAVNITANDLAGQGVVHADGGDGVSGGGGGGGGLIAVAVSGVDASSLDLHANPGAGTGGGMNGEAGLIYADTPGGPTHRLTVGDPRLALNWSRIAFSHATTQLGELVFSGTATIEGGTLALDPSVPLAVPSGDTLMFSGGAISNLNLIVRGGGIFAQANIQPLSLLSVEVDAGGVLTHLPNAAARTSVLNLDVSGDFNLLSGGLVVVDGLGYSGAPGGQVGVGPGGGGTGGHKHGGGGGHGGAGGAGADGSPAGGIYDSAFFPSDLGSQGGGSSSAAGGAGGGGVILKVGGTLTLDGVVSAVGGRGYSDSYYGTGGGGGAGGTIVVSAANLAGSGAIRADGGRGGASGGAGGGGGRIALSYGAKTATPTLSVAGGIGQGAGAAGTILDNSQLVGFSNATSTPTAGLTQMQANLSAGQNLSETVAAQTLDFSGGTSTGVTPGTFSQAEVRLVTLQTGSFAGDGFFRGSWTLGFPSGDFVSGVWRGAAQLDPSTRQMHVRGVIEGGIRGVLEGVLTESVPGSGVFDRMSVNCSATQIGTQSGAGSLYFTASAPAPQTAQYPGTPLNLVQASLTGQTTGYLVGPLENTFTLLTIASPGNPYDGEGFFLPTYSSSLGTGQGWAYADLSYGGIARLSGLYDQPLRSLFEGVLVTASPQSLLLTLERLDVGLPVQPLLSVVTTYPHAFGSGSTNSYTITVRNDGYAAATNMSVVSEPSQWADFVSATGNYTLYVLGDWWLDVGDFDPRPVVRWDIAQIPPRTSLTFTYQAKMRFPSTTGPQPHQTIDGGAATLVPTAYVNQLFAGLPAGATP